MCSKIVVVDCKANVIFKNSVFLSSMYDIQINLNQGGTKYVIL